MSTISERVQRGAQWLDDKLPGWWETDRFSLASFEMEEDCRCVVGQLSPQKHYGSALAHEWLDLTEDLARDLGFWAGIAWDLEDGPGNRAEYVDLEVEWRRVITERRAEAARAER